MANLKYRNSYLFVIGIGEYQSDKYTNLSNAVSDCHNLVEVLTNNYGFEVIAQPLYNGKATRESIIDGLNSLISLTTKDDNLIIYYAGHGQIHSMSNKGYWIPNDATDSVSSFIPNSYIKDVIEDIPAKHIFFISDSCFSGTFLTRTRSIDNESHYAKLDSVKSRWALVSGREEPVSDGKEGQGSPFSISLLKILKENDQDFLSVMEIINYVTKSTGSSARQQPLGSHIDHVGHEGGQMILIKSRKTIKDPNETHISKEHVLDLMKTYGYYLGQETSIDRICVDYPDLKMLIIKARLEWNTVFIASVDNVKSKLVNLYGEKWPEIEKQVSADFKDILNSQKLTAADAAGFATEIKNRAKGNIESPMLEILLAYKPEFKENPIMEFFRGFRQKLDSLQSLKSKGLSFEIEFPLSWSVRDGKRPNVLWVLSNFYKDIITTILVNKISTLLNIDPEEVEAIPSKDLADHLFTKEFLVDDLPVENVANIHIERTIIDACPCAITEYEAELVRAAFKIKSFYRVYYVIYKDFLLYIGFQINKDQKNISSIKDNLRIFFNTILNSLIIRNRYE